MAYLPYLLTVAGMMLLAAMSPGPDFVAVSAGALAGRRDGVAVALGVACGIVAWATFAVFGLAAMLARLGWIYEGIRLCGAAYLAWLGLKMLLAARTPSPAPAEAVPPQGAARPKRGGFRHGLLVNLSNPKAVVFFGSLFVTILPVGAPAWVEIATVAVVAAVSTLWFLALALMFSAGRVRAAYLRLRRPIDALMGAALLGLGARLAAE